MPWKECNIVEERLRFIARLLDGEKMAVLCREFGIARKTGYKIYNRYKDCGIDGLTDRSRRPYRHTNQLPMQIEKLIVNLKKEYTHWGWGAIKIRERLRTRYTDLQCPAVSTVHAVLDRHGLVMRHMQVVIGLGQRQSIEMNYYETAYASCRCREVLSTCGEMRIDTRLGCKRTLNMFWISLDHTQIVSCCGVGFSFALFPAFDCIETQLKRLRENGLRHSDTGANGFYFRWTQHNVDGFRRRGALSNLHRLFQISVEFLKQLVVHHVSPNQIYR